MAKRVISLLAVICLLLTVFAACGKDPVTSDTSDNSTPDVSTSESDVSDTSDTPDTSDVSNAPTGDKNPDNTTTSNGGGNKTTTTTKKKDTASSGNKVDYQMPFDKPVTFTLYLTEHANQPIKADSMKWDVITEMTNVTLDVDIGSGSNANTKLSAASASGKMYDITCVEHSTLRNLKTSLFMDLTKVMKTETPHYYELVKDEKDLALYKVDGKHLGFSLYTFEGMDEPMDEGAYNAYIRKDLLDKENLKIPTTWQEWFTTMKTLKAKYPDSIPFSGRSVDYILYFWTEALGGQKMQMHYNSVAGKFVCGAMQSNYRSVLQFMNQCYREGILDPNFDKASTGTCIEAGNSNKLFFLIDNGSTPYTINNELAKTNKEARLYAINLMSSHLNNNKKTGTSATRSCVFSTLYCLSAKTQNKDKLLDFMDWCYTEEGMLVNSCGKQGVTYDLDKNGEAYVPKKVWSKYINNAMPEYAWMSDLGLGQLCFAPRLLNNEGIEWKDRPAALSEEEPYFDDNAFKAQLKQGSYVAFHHAQPDVDANTQMLFTQINTYIRTQTVKFIKGDRALSEYNTFLNELKKMGIEDLMKKCNS